MSKIGENVSFPMEDRAHFVSIDWAKYEWLSGILL
jgi:hypothetical protein